jgi:hypothetical protein
MICCSRRLFSLILAQVLQALPGDVPQENLYTSPVASATDRGQRNLFSAALSSLLLPQ